MAGIVQPTLEQAQPSCWVIRAAGSLKSGLALAPGVPDPGRRPSSDSPALCRARCVAGRAGGAVGRLEVVEPPCLAASRSFVLERGGRGARCVPFASPCPSGFRQSPSVDRDARNLWHGQPDKQPHFPSFLLGFLARSPSDQPRRRTVWKERLQVAVATPSRIILTLPSMSSTFTPTPWELRAERTPATTVREWKSSKEAG